MIWQKEHFVRNKFCLFHYFLVLFEGSVSITAAQVAGSIAGCVVFISTFLY